MTLVDNAIAHSEKGTRFEVRSGPEAGQVRVDVIDHGDGVDVADVEGLTRRFSR
ncbi:ATP-binding protein, partial [Terrabacter sp. Soil810]|uniref:ATP-binding protein n=1 Tax=Terrabacter sp. Soil810 TaxID=1736418 RepID=UPI0021008072